ncbi:uncharacterized protein LOC122737082 [Dromiciops gliroides]|uniref:uncharacterized protein LOC122737082 n=1 Tax=Dromiciops gliroides TaxID=33562 RepID=UPI001CC65361|nr:uncharacterized protein LOC122737082 [Dromiciops gliroides]
MREPEPEEKGWAYEGRRKSEELRGGASGRQRSEKSGRGRPKANSVRQRARGAAVLAQPRKGWGRGPSLSLSGKEVGKKKRSQTRRTIQGVSFTGRPEDCSHFGDVPSIQEVPAFLSPGAMGPGGGLYACDDPQYWTAVLGCYKEVIRAKEGKSRKLVALDAWYQEELPVSIRERKEKYLTRDELVKLMEWKLARGKFRPRLQHLVATNPEELVKRCTAAAFSLLPNVEAAITELSQLKAVGPATASAILTAGAPETTAFMADEAVAAVPDLPGLQYTLKYYLLYLDKIQDCAKRLNQVDASSGWTPHQIEMCLWTWTMAQKLCPTVLPPSSWTAPKAKEGAEDVRPPKKRKASIP